MDRLTHERNSGIKKGYWSPARKEELVQHLADYEDTGLEPEQIREMDRLYLEKCQDVTELKKRLEWIPVAKRPPEEDGDYLVTMVTPGFNKGRPYTNWLYWDGDDQEWTDTDGDMLSGQETEVVAWKPLPEPYRPQN